MARSFGTLAAAAAVAVGTVPAAATGAPAGTTSLAEVLAGDGDTFDGDWQDNDITTGAALTTAQGGAVTVDVRSKKVIRLVDADATDLDARLDRKALDLNKGNLQIAHGTTLVLRPVDLP